MIEIGRFGYFWLDTWVMANVVQLATQDFCTRFLNLKNDPCGRQYDQMTQAARSAPANIAEGNSRHAPSKETEMKLTDVARATLAELAHDYQNWLLRHESLPWSVNSQEYQTVSRITLDRPAYKDDVQHQSSIHILAQKHKFDTWLKSDDSLTVAKGANMKRDLRPEIYNRIFGYRTSNAEFIRSLINCKEEVDGEMMGRHMVTVSSEKDLEIGKAGSWISKSNMVLLSFHGEYDDQDLQWGDNGLFPAN